MAEPLPPDSASEIQPAVTPVVAKKSSARWPDSVLAALVLAFAFLAASFPARNSDLWLHLATGRALADGEYHFGVDPFAYTTQDVYWANHSWLYDLLVYHVYQSIGGPGLVVLKALGVLLLAGLMLRISRPNRSILGPFWMSGGCTLLAMLAMSPRLLLQPASVSFLLLGLCLWLLNAGGRLVYLIPIVIVAWVNLDAWFILGPILVLLWLLGQRLSRALGDSTACSPYWLFPACIAAVFVSPHHYHSVLSLPPELSPSVWWSDMHGDVRFANLFASPWHTGPLGEAGGYNLAAWGYFALLAIGAGSFAVNRRGLCDWRFPVWLVFAGLSAWQSRLAPFFAVVAGPITALNLRQSSSPGTLSASGRSALTACAVLLLLLTWPGWLQGIHRRDRPLKWEVHIDPTLLQVAQTFAQWRKDGLLPSPVRTFANHPDVADYCVWFCPNEKVFLDLRVGLFASAASDFERICLKFDSTLNSEQRDPAGWERAMESHNIGCVILYDADLRRLARSIAQVVGSPEQWDIVSIEGQSLVVAWKRASIKTLPHFNAEVEAYASNDGIGVPEQGPAQLARPSFWWDQYHRHSTGSSSEAEAAGVYLRLFERAAAAQIERQRDGFAKRNIAGLVALPALQPSVPLVASRVVFDELFAADVVTRSPALPLLAIRSARRGIASHPDDANAWLTLALAYLSLSRTTAEGAGYATLPPLVQIRQVQAMTALNQAVALKPDLAIAHESLARLYSEVQILDLSLRHYDIYLNLVRRAGRPSGEEPTAYANRLNELEQTVDQLRRVVQDNENRFVVRSYSLISDPLARARVAQRLGLVNKAIDDVLLKSHADLYGLEGLRLLVDLLLLTGRAQDAREVLDREELRRNPNGLGYVDMSGNSTEGRRWSYKLPEYTWCEVRFGAATGDYSRAEAALERMQQRFKIEGELAQKHYRPQLAVRVAAEIGFAPMLVSRMLALMEENQVAGNYVSSMFLDVERADMHVIEGMLLLERGLPTTAAEQFRLALALYEAAKETAPALPGKPLARSYLNQINSYAK